MPIFVKGHRRGKSVVKAYEREDGGMTSSERDDYIKRAMKKKKIEIDYKIKYRPRRKRC